MAFHYPTNPVLGSIASPKSVAKEDQADIFATATTSVNKLAPEQDLAKRRRERRGIRESVAFSLFVAMMQRVLFAGHPFHEK